MKKIEKTIEIGGRKLTLSTGVLAEQASGAVLAQYGDTVVLATVVSAPLKQDLGYFPLTVDYQERLYAGGRIKGSRWVKREGRPSDDEILAGRLIDRSIRPLFPHSYHMDVQVMITVLSVDIENDPVVLAAVAASAAIAVSPIPWKGPTATVRIGRKDDKFVVNPVVSAGATADLDLVVSTTKDAVLMIEAKAKEIPEEEILKGIEIGWGETKKIIKAIGELAEEIAPKKEVALGDEVEAKLKTRVKKLVDDKVEGIITTMAKHEGDQEFEEIKKAIISELPEEKPECVAYALEKIVKEKAREMTLDGIRVDGRKYDEIRKLSSQVGVLPRTHGSAIFQRGQTQVLTVITLGAPSLEQLIESAEGEESKRYIHHYSMPPYATGQTGRVGSPNRREIGHGALAEKALEAVIPPEDKFPYTIRVVSEVMSSNGSTSMASVCASSLSLMDAGVPIIAPVSGVAMGLVTEGEKKYTVLSDIMGMEDYFVGDMDFKVAGTKSGITALQLDVKTLFLTLPILKDALAQAKEGRAHILESILETLAAPRPKISIYAPKIQVVKIPVEKIGDIIGPGGRIIKKIIAETGAQVDVEDDGSVSISATTEEALQDAVSRVEALVKEVVASEIYEGEVKRIQPFGAFVEILPGKEGMVHVSDMAEDYVADPADKVKLGDKVKVRVKEIDDLGRINLSMLMDASKDKPREERPRPSYSSGGGFGGPRRSFGGGRPPMRRPYGEGRFERRDDRRPQFGERRSGGPHFPTSRFVNDKKDFTR